MKKIFLAFLLVFLFQQGYSQQSNKPKMQAMYDAIKAVTTPVVEVHISDIYAREGFRAISVTGVNCLKIISGKGLPGYVEAVEEFLK